MEVIINVEFSTFQVPVLAIKAWRSAVNVELVISTLIPSVLPTKAVLSKLAEVTLILESATLIDPSFPSVLLVEMPYTPLKSRFTLLKATLVASEQWIAAALP